MHLLTPWADERRIRNTGVHDPSSSLSAPGSFSFSMVHAMPRLHSGPGTARHNLPKSVGIGNPLAGTTQHDKTSQMRQTDDGYFLTVGCLAGQREAALCIAPVRRPGESH
jgi:hypothetical protein